MQYPQAPWGDALTEVGWEGWGRGGTRSPRKGPMSEADPKGAKDGRTDAPHR